MKKGTVSAVFAALTVAGCATSAYPPSAVQGHRDGDHYAGSYERTRADVGQQLERIDRSLDNRAAPAVEACRVVAENILYPQEQAIQRSGYSARFTDCHVNARGNVETSLTYALPPQHTRLMDKIVRDACVRASSVYDGIERNQLGGLVGRDKVVFCTINPDRSVIEFRPPAGASARDLTRYPAPGYGTGYGRW